MAIGAVPLGRRLGKSSGGVMNAPDFDARRFNDEGPFHTAIVPAETTPAGLAACRAFFARWGDAASMNALRS